MCCVGCGPCAETDTTTAHSPKNAYLLNRSFVVSSLDGGEALANALAVKGDTLLDGELLLELGAFGRVRRCPPPSHVAAFLVLLRREWQHRLHGV